MSRVDPPVSFDPQAPLVIGGLGGSGTRLVAEIAMRLGIFMGIDLNEANDNLWFTLLLKRPSVRQPTGTEDAQKSLDLLVKAMTTDAKLTGPERRLLRRAVNESPRPHDRKWLRKRARALRRRPSVRADDYIGWGWKEPNSHVFLDHLESHFPNLRYIHVLRHGLDMALSGNQNQIRYWHGFFGVPAPPAKGPSPAAALHFWCVANQRALAFERTLGSRFLAVNYDRLCLEPEVELPRLVSFVAGDVERSKMEAIVAALDPPRSIGRHQDVDLSDFDPADVQIVADMGFRIDARS